MFVTLQNQSQLLIRHHIQHRKNLWINHLLQRINLVGLRDVVEYHVQLFVGENLGIGLGLLKEPGDDFRHLLGGDPQVGRDLLQAILHHTHILYAPP